MMILQVLRQGALHGYGIAQRIHLLSSEELRVEEGSLYPALQKLLAQGGVDDFGHGAQSARILADRRRPAATRGRTRRVRTNVGGGASRAEGSALDVAAALVLVEPPAA
jgi:hypothetical protein